MDGSSGKIYTDLLLGCFRRAYAREYHTEIDNFIHQESSVKGYTSNGVKYYADWNTLSGSSVTSIRNTLANAFTHYLAFRLSGQNATYSWTKLGIYGGDDGITADLDPQRINDTFAKLGMLSKSEKVEQHNYVPFLGRIYINPWVNDVSFIDVARQLKKLHLSSSPNCVPVS